MKFNTCSILLATLLINCWFAQSAGVQGQNSTVVVTVKAAAEATYTPEELVALEKLKKSIEGLPEITEPYHGRDEYLITWLRARDLDVYVSKAKAMLLENLRWRKAENIDGILTEKFPSFTKSLPHDLQTVDKEGRPVLIVNFVKWDIRKIVLAGKLQVLLRYMNKVVFEEPSRAARDAGQVSGSNSTQYYVLTDLQGYSLRQHACVQCVRIFTWYVETYENYYPQLAKETIFVNSPKIFESIVELTKSLWSAQLTDHVIFLGYDKNEWTEKLVEFFALDQLPVKFGGKNRRKVRLE